MKTLELATGELVELDDEDYRLYRHIPWRFNGLVHRQGLYLHKLIVKALYGYVGEVDHKDRNRLNNRRDNLRPATRSENMMNQGLKSTNSTGYKGVSFYRSTGKYRAQIQYRGNKIFLGYYTDVVEAAKAYDKAAKHYHKDFAFLNFTE